MKRFEIMIRFESEDYPAAIKRVAKLLRENPDIMGTGIQGADPLTFTPVSPGDFAPLSDNEMLAIVTEQGQSL